MALARKSLKIYHHTCYLCGETFTSSSPCSKTCSGKHRTALSRWRSKLPELTEKIIGSPEAPEGMLQFIGFYLNHPEIRDSAIAALKAIQDEINNQLNLHNIRRVK